MIDVKSLQNSDELDTSNITFFSTSKLLCCTPQTRTVAGAVFLEVCVENQNATTPMFLEYVRLEPASGVGDAVDHMS